MKKFKYNFTYNYKEYRGELESPLYLDCYGGDNEKTLMRMLASKYGFGPDFANASRSKYNILVYQI